MFSGEQIDVKGSELIAAFLKNNRMLIDLHLWGFHFSSLSLIFSGNEIDDSCVHVLVNSLFTNKSLMRLILSSLFSL
jgi:hypothetical protein